MAHNHDGYTFLLPAPLITCSHPLSHAHASLPPLLLPTLQVLEGMFGLADRLFDVQIVAADGEAPTWHSDVRFFKVIKVCGGNTALLVVHATCNPQCCCALQFTRTHASTPSTLAAPKHTASPHFQPASATPPPPLHLTSTFHAHTN